jgi:hypothetical protein
LTENLPVYPAYQYLDSIATNKKVLSIGSKFNLYTQNEIWGDPVTAGYPLYVLDDRIDPATVYEMVKQEGYEFLLVDWSYVHSEDLDGLAILNSMFLKLKASLRYSWANFSVYDLSAADGEAETSTTNLLDDPGFEQFGAGITVSKWQSILANLENVGFTSQAHSGNYALKTEGEISVQQTVQPVKGGEIYSLSHWTVADQPGQIARLQINWMDENSDLTAASILLIDVELEWRRNGMAVTAPEDAVKAGIFVSVQNASQVVFDDFCFAEGVGCLP